MEALCFMFMFLEAIHMYGLVASVVKMKGMLATKQNIVVRGSSLWFKRCLSLKL